MGPASAIKLIKSNTIKSVEDLAGTFDELVPGVSGHIRISLEGGLNLEPLDPIGAAFIRWLYLAGIADELKDL